MINNLLANSVHVEKEDELIESLKSGRKLRVKFGIDPSAPDIHLGHSVVLNKLREFQKAGHTAVLIIGDFTARIGDPTGKSETRKSLSEEEVNHNAQTYLEQVFTILDKETTEVRYQSEWFGGMGLAEVLKLAGTTTVAQLLQREDFSKRTAEMQPIGLHEFLYPLLQGYDSFAIQSDLELGGTDQLYNLLFARDLQKTLGDEPQQIMTMPLLIGLDGSQKMGKSLNNYIGVTDNPSEMYGKIMSIPDSLILDYFRLVSDASGDEIREVEEVLSQGENPKISKMLLAKNIVKLFHSSIEAQAAEDAFVKQFQKKETPSEIKVFENGKLLQKRTVAEAIFIMGLAESKGDARRLVAQNGVRLNGVTQQNSQETYSPNKDDIWQVGKRKFMKI